MLLSEVKLSSAERPSVSARLCVLPVGERTCWGVKFDEEVVESGGRAMIARPMPLAEPVTSATDLRFTIRATNRRSRSGQRR